MPASDLDILRDALWACRKADLTHADLPPALRLGFIIDGQAGRMLLPAPRTHVDAGEISLHVPEDRDDALSIHAHITHADEVRDGPWIDRWSAYHGPAAHLRLAVLTPIAYRLGSLVADAEELPLINGLHAVEPKLVRQLNADRSQLAQACTRALETDVHEALAVGVDPLGLDIRTRIGVLRVRLVLPSHGAAPETLAAWLAS